MPLIARGLDAAAEMESSVEESERAVLRLFVCVVLTHERFNLLGEWSADRRVPLCGENLCSSQRSPVQPDGDVLTGGLGAVLVHLDPKHPSDGLARLGEAITAFCRPTPVDTRPLAHASSVRKRARKHGPHGAVA